MMTRDVEGPCLLLVEEVPRVAIAVVVAVAMAVAAVASTFMVVMLLASVNLMMRNLIEYLRNLPL
jgi:hypothetical protein